MDDRDIITYFGEQRTSENERLLHSFEGTR